MDRFRMLPSYHYEDNTDGTLLKSVGKPLRDYKIEGNCFQDGTPSPENPIDIQCCGEKTLNLFDINGNINTRPNNGTVINEQRNYMVGENQLNICGSSSSNLGTGQVIKVQTGDTYTVSFRVVNISGGNIGVTIYKHGTTETIKSAYGYNIGDVVAVSFTATTDEILVGFNKGGVAYGDTGCIIENIQLQKGDTATEFEPYGYKVPVTVSGKNLIPKATEDKVIKGVSWTVNTDGTVNAEGTVGTDNSDYYIFGGLSENDEEFILSNNAVFSTNYVGDGNNLLIARTSAGSYYAHSNYAIKTIPKGTVVYGVCIRVYNRTVSQKNITYQLEYGSTVTAYEPYIPPQTYNIYLDEPLRKVGEYADYIDFKNGKVMRECYGQKIVLGSNVVAMTGDNWKRDGHSSFFINAAMDVNGQYVSYQYQLSNIFQTAAKGLEWSRCTFPGNYCLCGNTSRTFYFILQNEYLDGITDESTDAERIAAATTFLNNNDIEVVYGRLEPIEESVTLPQILTEKQTNIISVGTALQPSAVNYQYYKGGK